MKKTFLFLVILVAFSATTVTAQTKRILKKTLELVMPGTEGANGAGVAWHPVQKKYYAAFAGNTTFPLAVFNAQGQLLSSDEQTTLFDIRGIWYNGSKQAIQMNGYKGEGWAEYVMDSKGFPKEIKMINTKESQPDAQSVGAFSAKDKAVYFFTKDGNLEKYGIADGMYMDNITLYLGKTKDDKDEADNSLIIEDYNGSTVIYTGIPGAEIVLYDRLDNMFELYNVKDGTLTGTLTLPDDSPMPEFLNLSYANGIYWLFDKDARTWKGYK
jgi:hypothetical protein